MYFKTYLLIFQLVFCTENYYSNAMIGPTVRTANPTEYPFVVSIGDRYKRVPEDSHFCTGSLISANHVLTALHCLVNKYLDEIVVTVESYDLHAGRKVRVRAMKPYTTWAQENNEPNDVPVHDIVILTLAETLDHPNSIKAKLSTANNFQLVGTSAMVVGWGAVEGGQTPRYLQTAPVEIISIEECNDDVSAALGQPLILPSTMLCSKSDPMVTLGCGDSGGPLVNSITKEVVAINTATCPLENLSHPRVRNVHTGIDYYRRYIADVIQRG